MIIYKYEINEDNYTEEKEKELIQMFKHETDVFELLETLEEFTKAKFEESPGTRCRWNYERVQQLIEEEIARRLGQ